MGRKSWFWPFHLDPWSNELKTVFFLVSRANFVLLAPCLPMTFMGPGQGHGSKIMCQVDLWLNSRRSLLLSRINFDVSTIFANDLDRPWPRSWVEGLGFLPVPPSSMLKLTNNMAFNREKGNRKVHWNK